MYCFFCHEADLGCLPYDAHVGLESRILRETDNFLVVVDISPLTKGHLLLIPREHLLSFGAVPPEQRLECDRLIYETTEVLTMSYTRPIVMEHGSSSCHDGGACIAHAHLQFVPCNIDMLPSMQRFSPHRLTDFWDVSRLAADDESYLFLRDQNGSMYISETVIGIEKQFIRKEVGLRLGIEYPEWDWRQRRRLQLLQDTYHELQAKWAND